jgi:hypothetical protein
VANDLRRSGKNRNWSPDLVRERIRIGKLVGRLQRHALGECHENEKPMDTTQIRAAEILLRKAVPDLSSVEHSGAVEHRLVTEMTDAELLAIAATSSERVAEAQRIAAEPNPVH